MGFGASKGCLGFGAWRFIWVSGLRGLSGIRGVFRARVFGCVTGRQSVGIPGFGVWRFIWASGFLWTCYRAAEGGHSGHVLRDRDTPGPELFGVEGLRFRVVGKEGYLAHKKQPNPRTLQ